MIEGIKRNSAHEPHSTFQVCSGYVWWVVTVMKLVGCVLHALQAQWMI